MRFLPFSRRCILYIILNSHGCKNFKYKEVWCLFVWIGEFLGLFSDIYFVLIEELAISFV